jgi:uncharacterized protein YcgI (DUF1989 family)
LTILNFFGSVPVFEEGKPAETVFVDGRAKAGDYLDSRAEMHPLGIFSNCPQVNNPCNASKPTEIRLNVRQAEN